MQLRGSSLNKFVQFLLITLGVKYKNVNKKLTMFAKHLNLKSTQES